jgi:hypothetical protein
LFLGAGGLALFAPLGVGRASGLSLLALPLPALPERFLGPAGTSFVAAVAAYAAWSALVPLVVALIARLATPLRGIAAGLAFAQAGVLLHAALFRSIHLPYLPALLVPFWMLAGAFIAWWLGRALLQPESIR